VAAILGKKLGMTQVFREDGTVVPVTVIEAGPCTVTAIREPERDGYAAVQLAFGEVAERKLSKPELGHLKKAGAPAMRHLVEFRDADVGAGGGDGEEEGPKVGDEVTVAAFEPGQKVKVSGISIGKGFQGGIKRHNFSRGPVTHGSHNVRAPGSIGASAFPARVFKGMRMPGQMGNKRITQKGLEVAEVDAERNLLLIKGSVPGSRNAVVEVRTDG
jgi:large subunit ribosomal protein L3